MPQKIVQISPEAAYIRYCFDRALHASELLQSSLRLNLHLESSKSGFSILMLGDVTEKSEEMC